MKRALIMIGISSGLAVAGVLYYAHVQRKRDFLPFEDGPLAHVEWKTGAPPWEVRLHLVDVGSKSMANVLVNVGNNSGGNMSVTDDRGFAKIPVDEYDVSEIWLGTNRVVYRPRAYWIGYPNVKQGLDVFVTVKPSREINREPPERVQFYRDLDAARERRKRD